MAAVSSCPTGQLALLVDKSTQQQFLVDRGSSYSIIPHRSQEPTPGPRLCTADQSPIACWGDRKIHVAAGGRRFTWPFLLADVAMPIIGANFLRLVCHHRCSGRPIPRCGGFNFTSHSGGTLYSFTSHSGGTWRQSFSSARAGRVPQGAQHFKGVAQANTPRGAFPGHGGPSQPGTEGWTTTGWRPPRRSLPSWRNRASSGDPAAIGLLLYIW